MASYLDEIPKFREYVPQLPLEAMVKAGLYKQQKYEENVTKIQDQMEKIAGLDVYRPQDKAYLQSQLDELGGRLRMFAAGDFSNFQLANSVSGMTKQIAKDPTVQSAVASTAHLRKQKELQESLRKQGKAGESNDWLFNQEVNKWYNDPTPGASFNATYSPYTNWRKNSLEVIKSLTKDQTITDDAFTVDSKGNLVIADAIVRKKLSGISPEKVRQALLTGLTPDDFRQMETDGRYSYSNVDDQTFIKRVTDSYNDKISFYNNQKTTLENAKSSTNSVVEKQKLDDQIASLDKTIKDIKSEYGSITETVTKGDVESAKARLFTTDSLNNFAKTFSHTEASFTYENSPFVQAQQFRDTKAQEWKKFTMDYDQKERFHSDEQENKRLERKQKDEENRLKKIELEGYGGLPGPVDPSMVPKYDLSKLTAEVNAGIKQVDGSDNLFIAKKGKDKKWFDQQLDAWEKSPNSVDPDVAHHFASTVDIRRKVAADQQIILDANKAVAAKYGTIDDLIPKDAKSIDYSSASGSYRYTPKDFVDFNSIKDKYIKVSVSASTGGATVGTSYNDAAAKAELSDKMYNLYKIYKTNPDKLGSGGKELMNQLRYYASTVNIPYSKKVSSIMDETNKIINERLTTSQGVVYGIPTANAVQKTSIANVLNRFADIADKTGGGLPDSPEFESETARKLALEDGANYSFTVVEGTERQPVAYMMTVSGKAGTISMRVTPEQKAAVFGGMYEASPAVRAIRPYQEQMMKTGGYSTAPNPSAPTTQNNSFMTNVDFPNIGIYGVKGNLINVGKDPSKPAANLYTIKLAIYDPMSKSWINDISFPRSGLLTEEAVAPTIGGLNDAVLYELINEKPATTKDIKLLQSASKKPL